MKRVLTAAFLIGSFSFNLWANNYEDTCKKVTEAQFMNGVLCNLESESFNKALDEARLNPSPDTYKEVDSKKADIDSCMSMAVWTCTGKLKELLQP